MGFFTAFNTSAYPAVPFAALNPEPGFSMANAGSLGWAAQLAYEIGDRTKVEAVLSGWGWELIETIEVPMPLLPQVRALGAYAARSGSHVVVAISGTEPENLQDWFRDIAAFPNAQGIHAGFADGAGVMLPSVRRAVGDGAGGVYLTGHSLGAAVAALLAHRISGEVPSLAGRLRGVYGFGMPRAGDEAFAKAFAERRGVDGTSLADLTFRLVYGLDVVTQVPPSDPPFGFRHVGRVLATPHAASFDSALLSQADLEAAPAGPAAFLGVLAGLLPHDHDGLPPFPAQNRLVPGIVAMLPRIFRDHLMDRYLGAL